MNIIDIRPCCHAECSAETAAYHALHGGNLTRETALALYPDRATLAMVWRYLAAQGQQLQESPICLCRKIVRWSNMPLSLGQLMACLDIFQDVGLLQLHRMHKYIAITLTPGQNKADLSESRTMQLLLRAKEN